MGNICKKTTDFCNDHLKFGNHIGIHSKNNCQDNHCIYLYKCICSTITSLCYDCINKKKALDTKFKCSIFCKNNSTFRSIFNNYYNLCKKKEYYRKGNHECNKYIESKFIGVKGNGEYYTRCNLCYNHKCYRCGNPIPFDSICNNCRYYYLNIYYPYK
jgi:hypothetical protein